MCEIQISYSQIVKNGCDKHPDKFDIYIGVIFIFLIQRNGNIHQYLGVRFFAHSYFVEMAKTSLINLINMTPWRKIYISYSKIIVKMAKKNLIIT